MGAWNSARAVARQLLREHRSHVPLFHAYARLELHAGRIDEVGTRAEGSAPPCTYLSRMSQARKVYRAALDGLARPVAAAAAAVESEGALPPPVATPELALVLRALVELEVGVQQAGAALATLMAVALGGAAPEHPPSSSQRLKARMVRGARRAWERGSLPTPTWCSSVCGCAWRG
jgi:hypothetical protein